MALNRAQQRSGGSGEVWIAHADATFTEPSDATTALDDPFTGLGFTTPTGVRVSDAKTVNDQEAWQSFYAIRRRVNTKDFRIIFELLQWNAVTVALAFGGGEVTGSAGAYTYTPPDPSVIAEYAVVVDVEDGDEKIRFYAPRMTLVETVETNFVRTADAALPITFSALGIDASTPTYQIFFDTMDPQFAAASSS